MAEGPTETQSGRPVQPSEAGLHFPGASHAQAQGGHAELRAAPHPIRTPLRPPLFVPHRRQGSGSFWPVLPDSLEQSSPGILCVCSELRPPVSPPLLPLAATLACLPPRMAGPYKPPISEGADITLQEDL